MYIDNLDIEDLYRAYKKVKFELYNDKNNISTLDILEYESQLVTNIKKLFKDINKNGLKNISCKDYYEIPKSLESIDKEQEYEIEEKVHFFSSSIEHHQLDNKNYKKIELRFRKVINANINFHIVSVLWIEKIGQHIDSKFGNNIYGSRLVRIKPIETSSCEFDVSKQDYNLDTPRIFEPYQHKYQSWRNNSFKSIRELHESSSVIAITMDITSFYHSIELDFFTENIFYEEFELNFLFNEDKSLKNFHQDFIEKLQEWNKSISNDTISNGVPIGLSASSILANAVMRDFDKSIEENLAPTYYGRYVDDILLVFPDNGKMKSGEDIIKYLISKEIVEERTEDKITDLYYKYFRLKKSKQKIFYLDKNADLSIIDAIESEINSVSSEWRFMPDIGNKQSSLLDKIIGFYADGEEFNDALRKIDATTIKRLGLSLLISHSHSLNQYIYPKEWKEARYRIYDLIENHIFIPQNFFSNFTFIPKIFRLMIHSEDGEHAYCFLEKVLTQIDKFNNNQNITFIQSNGQDVQFLKFQAYNYYLLQEVFLESFNNKNKIQKRYYKKITELLFNTNILFEASSIKLLNYYNQYKAEESTADGLNFENIHMPEFELNIDIATEINNHLFLRDLSYDGYAVSVTEYNLSKNIKSIFYKIISNNKIEVDFLINIHSDDKNFLEILNHFNEQLFDLVPSNLPLVFPTRLFSAIDISIISSTPESNHNLFKYYVNFLRGNHSSASLSEDDNDNDILDDNIIEVTNKFLNKSEKIKIAITNFQVRDDYWKQSVIEKPVKSIERYNQVSQIVKEAVKKRPHYLVLPELAIPQEWAWLISKKLLLNNISLITGVEYIHTKKESIKIVHNSIMHFLVSDDIGFNYMRFYRQDKTEGAYSETIDLKNIANIELHPHEDNKEKYIYKHGNFYFSSLICNELTDIKNRMNLRGKVDALFAIEWNRDIKTFNALVESASLDIHSYVIQVNNRNYGDSRIRAPFSNDYKRDVVQVRGGNHDYLIVGEIDIKILRDFQSHNISPTQPFKPTPTGFKMLNERKNWKNEFSEDEE
jgi:hypothetical protein